MSIDFRVPGIDYKALCDDMHQMLWAIVKTYGSIKVDMRYVRGAGSPLTDITLNREDDTRTDSILFTIPEPLKKCSECEQVLPN